MKKHVMVMATMVAMSACTVDAQSDGMVLVKGGTFQMGSPASEAERDADETRHELTVQDFLMSPTEVSQQEYESVMGNNPSERKGSNLPVENVTWYDAIAYCNALSQREGLTPCYTINGTTVTWRLDANGYRLPTETEWEYAARGGKQTPFSFGDYVHDSDANCYNAYGYNNDASGHWVNGYLQHTVAVTEYPANAYGLYNMHGNVAEWTWDWYAEYGTNPEEGRYKVVRGGGWNDFPKHIRKGDVVTTAPNVRHWNGATPWSDCECMTVSDIVPGEEHAVQLKEVTDEEFTSLIKHETMIVRLAEIEVYPKHLTEYLKFANEVDRLSMEREPGVVCLFPMQCAEDSTQIRILEIYASEEAYQRHIKTEHFQKYKQGTMHMVKSLRLPTMQPLDPETMKLIFNKQR